MRRPSTGSRTRRAGRSAAALLTVVLAAGGLTVATAPAAHAAASDLVAKLPISSFSALTVDSAHQRVYVADSNLGSSSYTGLVAVYDFSGERVTTISTPRHVSGLALNGDGSVLYVGGRDGILRYDTATHQPVGSGVAGTDTCGRSLAFAGGRAYHTAPWAVSPSDCDTTLTYLDYSEPDNSWQRSGWQDHGKLQLEAGPGDRLMMGQPANAKAPDPFLAVYDASGTTLVRTAGRRFADGEGKGALGLRDMAFSPDGTRVAVADAAAGTRLLDSADLSDAGTGYPALPSGAVASAVAFSGDGKYLARGASASGATPDLLLSPADPADATPPLEFAFEGSLHGDRVAARGLEWSADGSRLFAVTANTAGNQYWLHVVQPPAVQYDTRFGGGLTHGPAQAVAGEALAVRGRLELDGPAPAQPLKVTATRTDAGGTHELGTATVRADGTFTVLDEPELVGEATYTVSFLGDLTHRPATDVTHTVSVGRPASAIALTAPAEASMGTGVHITGTFTAQGKALPERAVLKVERSDRLGTGPLSSVTVAADGTFAVDDLPRARRDTTYTLSWPGDDLHTGSTASATVRVTR
ncbi:Ig-like domain repeat protein [Streptomyces parvulus]|uniref:Ig-like domain repeat protein n=1 Tax=Streptomyces parvulus TaxID=146923 RepID=UPI00215DB058|nr:Ig-like domain repeat protein [Streptomyces parvulus]